MLHDMNNKDSGNFTFIQEQIASKRKSKRKRMLFSFVWTVILGCAFGVAAAFVFCISEPRINKMIGKNDGKKEIEFPTQGVSEHADGQELQTDKTATNSVNTPGSVGSETGSETEQTIPGETDMINSEDGKAETVIIKQRVDGNLEDLKNIYEEIKTIYNSYYRSLVKVTGTTSEVDWHNAEIDYSTLTTGLVIAENGADVLVLLNYDKISDAKKIEVTFWDDVAYEGKIQGYDEDLNIAVVAVSIENFSKEQLSGLKYAELGESYNISLGSPVLALGAPNGYVDSIGYGIISNKTYPKNITDGKVDVFHTDFASNENSEGIVVDLNGTVIGLISQALKDSSNQNVTTVIGISKIKKVIQSMVNETERPYFGIKALDMPETVLNSYNVRTGIYISEVLPNSPALEAGLQIGDIIVSINETAVVSVQSFQNTIMSYKPKEIINIKVVRTTKLENNQIEYDLILGKKNGS